jgi:hypothetical protein
VRTETGEGAGSIVKTPEARGEPPMTNDALIEEINAAYRRVSAVAEDLTADCDDSAPGIVKA